ncbi:hypothetical protein M9H77_34151 [Catharanthus roseus]|uniref:Uncharacterized protein n=1 Tax=Catharanthus roseus TaxID=4058 RepID=A0ACB9ZMU6_CATRO|nr:hypothetical protein M9H77_34151 [Catharanthus roseus]
MKNNVNMIKGVIKSTKPTILIQMVEVTSESSLEPPQEPETNRELPAPSSSTPDPPNIPETLNPILEGSDEEEEHSEAQAQALKDYQLARDRVRGVPKEHPRYGYSYIVLYAFAVASYIWLFLHSFICICCCILCGKKKKNHYVFLIF